ncbi:NADH-quinone oxidoreductase subunit NuoE [Candidatus Tachikawaea gelatinosa]|uniref:NADH-quinone oxidoreductase subunit E n=1 Tax=Candidatus Tachikawaea gelatinosa TaxID=1410383 RepID=A0A090BWB5_9ENTR|nr:NADH-quinone oxidoreductase subunit NuoE [Candidatus Tachikawaea gelatinosa]BAP58316.1 NADH-quinone oxidoreductase subunit E [Candidatus Tachikawaea gelatinosa]
MSNKKIPIYVFNNNESKIVLSDEEIYAIETEKKKYAHARAVVIEALKIVQKKRGWISDQAIFAISKILKISISDIEGIATFYSQIFRQPVGKHIIRYCDSVVCYINGYESIVKEITKILKIQPGETTEDGIFTLLPVCCLGNCDKSPTLMINNKTYNCVKSNQIQFLLEKY